MTGAADGARSDVTILLTRPEGENESLLATIASRGPTAFSPSVNISPLVRLSALPETPAMRKMAQDLDQIDKLFFVSKSAVRYTLPLLDSFWPQWPVTTSWFAVGEGTARELEAWNVQAAFPEQAGSEGLLALPALASIKGDRVVIVRGRGGRALLGDELERRGATLDYLETYQREPVVEPALRELPAGSIVVVTSVEILEALQASVEDHLQQFRLVTASARIADAARSMGPMDVVNAGGASDRALYHAIVEMAQTG